MIGIGAFSFYPIKKIGAIGDAGAITTNNDEFGGRLRALHNYGSEIKHKNEYVGYISRMDEIKAAMLSVKLKLLDELINHKRKLVAIYLSE